MKIEGVAAYRVNEASKPNTDHEPSEARKASKVRTSNATKAPRGSKTRHGRSAASRAPAASPLAPWVRDGDWRVRRPPLRDVAAVGGVATTGLRVAVQEREAINRLTALLQLATAARGSQLATVRALVAFAGEREAEFVAFARGR